MNSRAAAHHVETLFENVRRGIAMRYNGDIQANKQANIQG
jgi:hypothetical protein